MLESLIPVLIPLPILLPAVTAALNLALGRFPRWQRALSVTVLGALVLVALAMVAQVARHGIQVVQIGGWDAPVGITLVADGLSTLMIAVSQVVLFAVMWFGIGQGIRDGDDDDPVAVFIPTYMLLNMGVSLAFLAGDLFNMYVGFEVLLVASYVLLTLGASAARVRAGVAYVMVNMLSSMVFLLALAFVYASVGTLNMAHIAARMADIPSGVRLAVFATLLVAFCVKAAVWPLSAWLPDSYPTAPSLVTAVFAGLLTKVGVYAIIRARYVLFPIDRFDDAMMVAGIMTMIMGILGAMAQNDIKRLLSFTLVSHIGYMIFGIALGSRLGLGGAIFYAAHHILVQTALFLVVGLIERQAGSSSLRRLGGLAKASGALAVLYLIPAMNLGGIPPFSGFMGKVLLIEAGVAGGGRLTWIGIIAAVVTSLLTLYTMVLVWSKAFWRDRSDAPDGDHAFSRPMTLTESATVVKVEEREDVGKMPWGMVVPTALLVTASIGVTVLAGPLSQLTDTAAGQLTDPQVYQQAVLGTPDDAPVGYGPGTGIGPDRTGVGDPGRSLPETAPASSAESTGSIAPAQSAGGGR